MHRLRVIAAAVLLLSGKALADTIPGAFDDPAAFQRQMAVLPNYCKYTQSFRANIPDADDANQVQRWRNVMGPSKGGQPIFEHMHHYCNGLLETNRALLKSDAGDKVRWLSNSIHEFDYVITKAPDGFVLLPEILTKKGENLLLLGRVSQATSTLQRAIDLKADYWPPYAVLSDHYRSTGDRGKARAVLVKALESAPNTKALQRRLAELDQAKHQR